jgi:hypothetical protein
LIKLVTARNGEEVESAKEPSPVVKANVGTRYLPTLVNPPSPYDQGITSLVACIRDHTSGHDTDVKALQIAIGNDHT